MSDVLQTAILNWLKATADDAMGMEPGDRHMANEAYKEIERLQKGIDAAQVEAEDYAIANQQLNTEIERLRDALERIAAEAVPGQYDEWAGEIAKDALKERDDE